MADQWFEVSVTYVFKGTVQVRAETKEEALETAEKHIGMTMNGIDTSMPEEDIDWNFPWHADKVIGRAKKIKYFPRRK